MNLFTHCAHREIERDMESGHREVDRDMQERVMYWYRTLERDMQERVMYEHRMLERAMNEHRMLERAMQVRVTVGYGMLLEAAILETPERMEELRRLLQDDPAILDRVMWECRGKDNPLHVGALHGNVAFVQEILSRKRELTHELNSERQSPLHLASARGHVEVVRELLSQDADVCLIRKLNSEGQSPLHLASAGGHVEVVQEILSRDAYSCFICDRDGMIPLHLAAIQGQLEVLEALFNAEKITAFILTKSEEPILHLCANNNKSKAIKKLIELVEEKDRLVNLRDRDGNTVLHLVSAQGNHEVIKFLLKNTKVDVNAENMDGCTPLDASPKNGKIFRGTGIELLLTGEGAKGGRKKSLYSGPRDVEGSINESRFDEALLVVVILVATVAFQARLSPPGGVWQDTILPNATQPSPQNPVAHNATQSSPPNATLVPHYAGQSIMSNLDPDTYKAFSALNDLTLSLSLLAILLLLFNHLFKSISCTIFAMELTFFSLVAMSSTYYRSAAFISSDKTNLYSGIMEVGLIIVLLLSFSASIWLLAGLRFFYFLRSKLKEICNTA